MQTLQVQVGQARLTLPFFICPSLNDAGNDADDPRLSRKTL